MLSKSSNGNGKNGNGHGHGKHANGVPSSGRDYEPATAVDAPVEAPINANEQPDHARPTPAALDGSRIPSPSELVQAWPSNDAALKLKPRQQEAIALLVQGYFDLQIAEETGIGRTTLWRWKNFDPEFRRVLAKARAEAYYRRVDRQGLLLDLAADTLERVLRCNHDQKQTINVARLVWAMAGCLKPRLPGRSRRSRRSRVVATASSSLPPVPSLAEL